MAVRLRTQRVRGDLRRIRRRDHFSPLERDMTVAAVEALGTRPVADEQYLAQVVHEADIDDGLFDAPEAAGFDVALRGLSMVATDDEVLALTGPVFDGAYEFFRRELLLGKEPA